MEKPFIRNTICDSSLEKEMNHFNLQFEDTIYEYYGIKVPRVTHILSSMLHEDYLMEWANAMGRFKHIDHTVVSEEAATVGTYTHKSIEDFLREKKQPDFEIIDRQYKTKVYNAFSAFLRWWSIISQHDIEILMIEQPLVCEYFGGTLDLLIKIDGKIYLVDFKTSNHLSYKYHLQAAAYRRMLFTEFGITIDGVIILQLSKYNSTFREQMITLSDYDQLQYMNECDRCFLSLVYGYYNRLTVENGFKSF